jgi:hypothetical protein
MGLDMVFAALLKSARAPTGRVTTATVHGMEITEDQTLTLGKVNFEQL